MQGQSDQGDRQQRKSLTMPQHSLLVSPIVSIAVGRSRQSKTFLGRFFHVPTVHRGLRSPARQDDPKVAVEAHMPVHRNQSLASSFTMEGIPLSTALVDRSRKDT